MRFYIVYTAATLFSLSNAHGVIIAAQGEPGSPASKGFKVDDAIARNCTGISPCQQDTTIMRDAEIKMNIVNECGRTQIGGNIDVGEETENAIAAKAVTQVKPGTQMTVTIHQVNADGAGPYFCDLDETSNTGKISQNLTVTNNVPGANGLSQAKFQEFNITVTMPDQFKCIGGSTGDICTVRCRNNALAGPFGGCVAVQQSGSNNTNTANTPENIQTMQAKAAVLAQTKQNKADLKAAITANQVDGSQDQENAIKETKTVLKNVEPATISYPATDIMADGIAKPAGDDNAKNATAAADENPKNATAPVNNDAKNAPAAADDNSKNSTAAGNNDAKKGN